MTEYLFLMHGGTAKTEGAGGHADWGPYIDSLKTAGALQGGSAMGGGVCVRKDGGAPEITRHLTGYIKVEAETLDAARALLDGNPVYEAGGVVEIRELPVTG